MSNLIVRSGLRCGCHAVGVGKSGFCRGKLLIAFRVVGFTWRGAGVVVCAFVCTLCFKPLTKPKTRYSEMSPVTTTNAGGTEAWDAFFLDDTHCLRVSFGANTQKRTFAQEESAIDGNTPSINSFDEASRSGCEEAIQG